MKTCVKCGEVTENYGLCDGCEMIERIRQMNWRDYVRTCPNCGEEFEINPDDMEGADGSYCDDCLAELFEAAT